MSDIINKRMKNYWQFAPVQKFLIDNEWDTKENLRQYMLQNKTPLEIAKKYGGGEELARVIAHVAWGER